MEGTKYRQAFAEGDPDQSGVWFGEAAGLIDEIESAADIVEKMASNAALHIKHLGDTVLS